MKEKIIIKETEIIRIYKKEELLENKKYLTLKELINIKKLA